MEINYTAGDVTDVATKDDVRVAQDGTGEYAIHQYKNFIGALGSVNLEWEGQSNTNASDSTIFLQIYNRNTPAWETVDSDNTTAKDTDFSLTATIADTTNYVDGSNVISCRIYQLGV